MIDDGWLMEDPNAEQRRSEVDDEEVFSEKIMKNKLTKYFTESQD